MMQNETHLQMTDCINELGVYVIPRSRVGRLRVHNVCSSVYSSMIQSSKSKIAHSSSVVSFWILTVAVMLLARVTLPLVVAARPAVVVESAMRCNPVSRALI